MKRLRAALLVAFDVAALVVETALLAVALHEALSAIVDPRVSPPVEKKPEKWVN